MNGGGGAGGLLGLARTVGVPIVPATIALSLLHNPLAVSVCLSCLAAYLTWRFIPAVAPVMIAHGRSGKDLLKPGTPVRAESLGLIAGIVYLGTMFVFIPVPFVNFFRESFFETEKSAIPHFPHDNLGQYLSGLLSLFSMLFLGFVDDVVDIRWRVKIWMPLIASIPLLMVYFVTYNGTYVVIPTPLRALVGASVIDLGVLYYLYMAALTVFSTNAINIIAGVNGVEAGQSLVIAASIAANDMLQISTTTLSTTRESHLTSLYFLLPLIGVSLGFLAHNWYPARVFGGDTYVYFAGMTFAVVGILGRFSKTVLLFMIPQMFNFLYSCPQLFGFVECPRHRMPKYNPRTKKIEASRVSLANTGTLGLAMIKFLQVFGLADVTYDAEGQMRDCNNLTLINLVLVRGGPAPEWVCALRIVGVQAICSVLGFSLRYGLAFLMYPV
ncbi:UDP-N-acetylglucosamine--dolichyl-phosphate N-acetylglucosaminephosphotransferase [Cladochytrium tenue]|nr:UDP-N-acetylglucosamine--dolichyl-phosphate N-acetylglucosaminephosphotransferase [Cladochytrium tenue]